MSELAEKWQGDPNLVAPVELHLAQAYLKLGDPKHAEAHADKVLQAATAVPSAEGEVENPIADKVISDAFQAKAQAQVDQKKEMAAVETYQKLLDRYEEKMALGSVRYKVGQILFDRGDLKGAHDVLPVGEVVVRGRTEPVQLYRLDMP